MSLKVNEIYFSIQGESTYAGRRCIFIRLTYCNLRCSYCDTEYAFYDGTDMKINDILHKIKQWDCNLVEVTGGEPLIQEECIDLLTTLNDNGYEVLIETGGSLPVSKIPKEIIKIIDFKCPSSGMNKKNLWTIIKDIQAKDEIKFVIGNKNDFEWAKSKIYKYRLQDKCTILFSPVFNKIKPNIITKWILKDNLPVRMQIQMHKYIWEAKTKGV